MYVGIYVCICIDVCIYVCMYVCMYTSIYLFMCEYVHRFEWFYISTLCVYVLQLYIDAEMSTECQ